MTSFWLLGIVFALTLSFAAIAETKLSVMGSVNYNSPETDDSDEDSEVGYGGGVRALMGIKEQFHFRSGAGLVSKSFGYEGFDLKFLYLNIPLTFYWQASNEMGFFGGTALNAKMDSDCDGCTLEDEKSLVWPLLIGFDFNFCEKVGMELSYEHGITETAKDIKVHSAVASLLYHFK